MSLTIGEKISIIMKRQGITMTELAASTGQTRQNLTNKMKRDNFSEKEAREMARALGVELEIAFRFSDGSSL